MGAWGEGLFESDAALDWVMDLMEMPDGSDDDGKDAMIVSALLMAADEDDGFDSDSATYGLCAAEIVAAMLGKPGPELAKPQADSPAEALAEWIRTGETQLREMPDIRTIAANAVKRAADSELADLWEEAEEGSGEWRKSINDLLARLKG